MSKDRILGSSTVLQIYGPSGPVPFLEIDSFTAKNAETMEKRRPLGQVPPHPQVIYGGWELTLKGGKVDESWDQASASNDEALLAGQSAPRYRIVDTTIHMDGHAEVWNYEDVVLHGFNRDAVKSDDEIKVDCSGFSPRRTAGSVGTAQGGGLLSQV